MALLKPQSTGWDTLHLLVRILGVTGLTVAMVGLVLWLSLDAVGDGQLLTWIGAGLVGLAALVELPGWLKQFTARRGAMGVNVLVQTALAVGLLVGGNWFAAQHYHRFDLTESHEFTLPEEWRGQLSKLRGTDDVKTDIVVYQRHRSFGQVGEATLDHYDSAAERKIVEKVQDLVELFQDLGPRFYVEVLDVHDLNFQKRLTALKKRSPFLAEAIDKAPENSVFFHANGKVQRLAFHDIFQLDKDASLKANHGDGNLVLHDQGVEAFARKILNIEAKQPRIAVATIHPFLSLSDDTLDFYHLNGAKKLLESQGLATVDILTRKALEEGGLGDPGAYTFDESQFDTLEEERLELEAAIKTSKEQLKILDDVFGDLRTKSLEDLNKQFIYAQIRGAQGLRFINRKIYDELKKEGLAGETSDVDEKDRARELNNFSQNRQLVQLSLERLEPDLEKNLQKMKALNVENLDEQRRESDVKLKLKRLLKDCDLLILPRVTLIDVPNKNVLPNRIHRLNDAQFAAVQEFMKAGKPVLFLLGPGNEPKRPFDPSDLQQPDQVEQALEQMGFKLPSQTVLFDSEMKSFAERRGNFLIAGVAKAEYPPVRFDWQSLELPGKAKTHERARSHPIRTSVRLMMKSQGPNQDLAYKLRHDRPVYFFQNKPEPSGAAGVVAILAGLGAPWAAVPFWLDQSSARLDEHAVLMVTDSLAWNEDQPFPTRERTPRYEATKPGDPNYGTILERRRGPFPIAAATQAPLPKSWYPDGKTPAEVRVVVVGNGGAFTGKNLNPVQQKLLIDSVNWLLGRSDLLATEQTPWQYPRVQLTDTHFRSLIWGMCAGPVLAAIYLGLLVWLVRRMR